MEIIKIEALKKVDSKWNKKKDLYEIRLDIEVSENDQLYNDKGVYLSVEYLVNDNEITRYHFFEKETDKYIKLAFAEGEEEMVLEYLKRNLVFLVF